MEIINDLLSKFRLAELRRKRKHVILFLVTCAISMLITLCLVVLLLCNVL
jgi:hypothetical protein